MSVSMSADSATCLPAQLPGTQSELELNKTTFVYTDAFTVAKRLSRGVWLD